MAIRGAIFDCDGTLIDSMPMWTATCVRLLERYGVGDAERVFAEHESLDMDKKCYWYHDNLGIGESGEALYHELWDMVEHEYRHGVQPFPGCAELLERLRAAHVPMVVASSTPIELLRIALEAHGLLGYFDELVFAGDVGRGKEHPDVYLAACERLGTSRESTWVFEDAPFGIRSAARVGFPVVALLNDHDGRDEEFVARWGTVVARGYQELSMNLLKECEPRVLHALVVAGSPSPSSPALVARLAREADYVVAADRGAERLMDAGVSPHVFCGDEDSCSVQARDWAHAYANAVVRHPAEKDDTDLGLAIDCARVEADRVGASLSLTITCASGGRPDHGLGVWGVLARNAAARPVLVEDTFTCHVLAPQGSPSLKLDAPVGTVVSTVALAPNTVVSECGLRWELDHATLNVLSDLGVSNRVTCPPATVACHSGVLAVFVLAKEGE